MTPFIRLRRDLSSPVAPPAWPYGYRPITFSASRAPAVHALLAEAYADAGGEIGPLSDWWPALRRDSEYDRALVFLAAGPDGALAGMVHAWTSGFVKDVAVARAHRRRGVGAALLLAAIAELRRRGAPHSDLKVRPGNHAALQFYGALDMAPAPEDP